jgi:hypothetical protein
MKKAIFTCFMLMIVIFFSCKKSDSTSTSSTNSHNGFTILNKFYPTENAGIAYFDSDTTYNLVFYSNSVSFDIPNQQWKGTGNMSTAGFLKSNTLIGGVPVGNYIYQDNEKIGYFTDASALINYNWAKDTGDQFDGYKGNINIAKVGNLFQISYNFEDDDSLKLVGTYTGRLPDITSWIHVK